MKSVRKRNRQQTMERILWALGEVIAERGAEKAGVNSVAEKAGVNKVLIYRYFGGYEGLMEQFIQQGHFLSLFTDQFIDDHENLPESKKHGAWAEYMIQLLHEFRSRRASQELIRWELMNHESELGKRMTEVRNHTFRKILDKLGGNTQADMGAVTTLMVSGITFLVLASSYRRHLVDLDLQSEAGWKRIENAIERLYAGLSVPLESEMVAK